VGSAVAAFSADVVVVLHIGYLLYAAFGGFLALRGLPWLWLHLASSVWSVTVTFTAVSCPMTALEKGLIGASGSTPYAGTFIEQYLTGIVYPVEYETAIWVGGAATALASYAVVFAYRRAARAALPA
jgi:hypothetical protein